MGDVGRDKDEESSIAFVFTKGEDILLFNPLFAQIEQPNNAGIIIHSLNPYAPVYKTN